MRSWHSRAVGILENEGSGGARIAPMEGMRGVAVSLVSLVHKFAVFDDFWAPGPLGESLALVGHYGVDLFFMLSGYLIYGAVVRRPVSVAPFMRRRLERLYPTFAAVFALYVVLSFVVPGESKLPADTTEMWIYLAQNLLMLPGLLPITPMITVAWSMSFEIFFYLSVPLFVAALRLRAWPPVLRLARFAVLGVGLMLWTHLLELSLHARMLLFLSGMALFECKQMGQGSVRFVNRIAAVLVVAVLPVGVLLEESAALGSWALWSRTAWLAVVLPVIAFSAFFGKGLLAAALSWRPLRWLGNMSYSYYLLHGLVLKALGLVAVKLAPELGAAAFWLAAPVAFVATVIGSFVLYAVVEYPLSMAPKPATAAAPAR